MLTKKCVHALTFANEILSHPKQINPYELCEKIGVDVILDKPIEKDGYLVCCDGIKLIFVSSKIANPHRRKFIVAHEIGHFLMHQEGLFCCSHISDYSSTMVNSLGQENEANTFASELLLPNKELRKALPKSALSFSTITGIANRFDVSVTHAAMQAVRSSNAETEILLCYDGKKLRWFVTVNKGINYSRIPKICPINTSVSPAISEVMSAWDSMYTGCVHQEIFHTYANQYLILLSQS